MKFLAKFNEIAGNKTNFMAHNWFLEICSECGVISKFLVFEEEDGDDCNTRAMVKEFNLNKQKCYCGRVLRASYALGVK